MICRKDVSIIRWQPPDQNYNDQRTATARGSPPPPSINRLEYLELWL